MADTPETKAKRAIKKTIDTLAADMGITYNLRSNAAGGVGFTTGIPDLTLYWRVVPWLSAVPIDIEVKAKDNRPTPTQIAQLRKSVAGGTHGLVIWGDDKVDLAWLHKFLSRVEHTTPMILEITREKMIHLSEKDNKHEEPH